MALTIRVLPNNMRPPKTAQAVTAAKLSGKATLTAVDVKNCTEGFMVAGLEFGKTPDGDSLADAGVNIGHIDQSTRHNMMEACKIFLKYAWPVLINYITELRSDAERARFLQSVGSAFYGTLQDTGNVSQEFGRGGVIREVVFNPTDVRYMAKSTVRTGLDAEKYVLSLDTDEDGNVVEPYVVQMNG